MSDVFLTIYQYHKFIPGFSKRPSFEKLKQDSKTEWENSLKKFNSLNDKLMEVTASNEKLQQTLEVIQENHKQWWVRDESWPGAAFGWPLWTLCLTYRWQVQFCQPNMCHVDPRLQIWSDCHCLPFVHDQAGVAKRYRQAF